MTIKIEVVRTFRCDGWDCHGGATQHGSTEAEIQARGFPKGWTTRVHRERVLVEHLCPQCSELPPCPKGCMMCTNEACDYCGAGCWNNGATACDHDVIERHQEPDRRFLGLRLDHPAWKSGEPPA
jgi:hypothetical protein